MNASALAGASLVAATCTHSPLFALDAASGAVVKTANGPVRGQQAEGVRVFRGVPFAAPPVGPLRFRAPQKAQPWTGERDATQFSASAMQSGEPGVAQSEDCLYLNVWAPDRHASASSGLPVFVWIHGGGFLGGRSFDPLVDGAEFARAGIVCVTVAYRLGVFGFLDVEPLFGAEYAGSANNGLRDLIASLRWVQENIAAFGGDPKQVTIGGESAGAKLADILMGIASAQPLFHQVISESGGAERVWTRANSAHVAQGFAATWKTKTGPNALSLLTADAKQLIEAQHQFIEDWPQHFPLRAEIDGTLLAELPVHSIAAGSTRGKRLLIGHNREESALFIGPHPSKNATAADLGNLRLSEFEPVYEQYRALYPDLDLSQLRIRALTAEEYWVPSIRVADAHVAGGGSTYMYRLDFTESSGRLKGYAYHSLDVGMVWDRPHEAVDNAAAEAALGKQMHAAWIAFIRGEAPAAQGLPAWPEYREDTRPTMILDVQSRVEERPQEAELKLWKGLL